MARPRSSDSPCLAEVWRRAQRRQIVGPRHARPKRGCAWLRSRRQGGEFDPACARLPG
jgi:hypothetical protein